MGSSCWVRPPSRQRAEGKAPTLPSARALRAVGCDHELPTYLGPGGLPSWMANTLVRDPRLRVPQVGRCDARRRCISCVVERVERPITFGGVRGFVVGPARSWHG